MGAGSDRGGASPGEEVSRSTQRGLLVAAVASNGFGAVVLRGRTAETRLTTLAP